MKIISTIEEMQAWARQQQASGKRIGFVPTMGFLHEGHLSLVDLAKAESEAVVVSIFVNPTQFGENEDLDQYPRDFERDEELCRNRGVEVVFYPPAAEMYSDDYSTWVNEEALTDVLCGKSRPTHFRGVTTVVTKLFNAVLPNVAVFGQKDAQQYLVLERMVRDLNFPIKMIRGPIVRDEDGLALSSRNKYLTPEARQKALSINRSLFNVEKMYNEGESHAGTLICHIYDEIEKSGGSIDYIEVVSRRTLRPVETLDEPVLIAVAAVYGNTRLIDNVFLG